VKLLSEWRLLMAGIFRLSFSHHMDHLDAPRITRAVTTDWKPTSATLAS
jgi:hypothetical protein